MEVRTDDLVGGGSRVGDPAGNLACVKSPITPLVECKNIILAATDGIRHEAEEWSGFISVLSFAFREINALRQESAWRASLEAGDFKTEFAQAIAERGNCVTKASAGLVAKSHMEESAHEGACGDDHGACIEAESEVRLQCLDAIVAGDEVGHISLLHVEVRLAFQEHFHPELVGFFITLSAGRADAWSFCGIEHAELDAGGVCIECHGATEGVDLTNHVSFGESTYRGIAGHLADGIRVLSEQKRLATEAG